MIFLRRYKRYITRDKNFCKGLGVIVNDIIYNLIHVSKYKNLQCIVKLPGKYKIGNNHDPSFLLDDDYYWPQAHFQLERGDNKHNDFIDYIGSLTDYITIDIWYMKNSKLYSYHFNIHNNHLIEFELFTFAVIAGYNTIILDTTSLNY